MSLAKIIYKNVGDLSEKEQRKILRYIKIKKIEEDDRRIDKAISNFMNKHKNALIELAKK
ncbi:hypothetical protein ACAG39_01855 [Caldicellulosiruptoraceae bacterium PP1]